MDRSGVTQSALRGTMASNANGLARGIEETRRAGLMLVATCALPGRIQIRRGEPDDTGATVSGNKPRQTMRHPHGPLEHTRHLKEHRAVVGGDTCFIGQILLPDAFDEFAPILGDLDELIDRFPGP